MANSISIENSWNTNKINRAFRAVDSFVMFKYLFMRMYGEASEKESKRNETKRNDDVRRIKQSKMCRCHCLIFYEHSIRIPSLRSGNEFCICANGFYIEFVVLFYGTLVFKYAHSVVSLHLIRYSLTKTFNAMLLCAALRIYLYFAWMHDFIYCLR